MRFLWVYILCICAVFQMHAQSDTIHYDSLITQHIGNHIPIPFTSRVTGGADTFFLKDGQWLYNDSLGNTLVELHFSANKRKKSYEKHGLEIFMDPETGDTILIRNYTHGTITEQLGVRPAILNIENNTYHIYKDFGSYTVAVYRTDGNGRVDFTTLWKSSIENPTDILNDTNYLKQEALFGDPSLLQPANYGTKSEFNYVSNPEFERHPNAVFSIMSFTQHLTDWSVASESPDLYISSVGALSGNSFVGIRVFSLKKDIEYVQNKLRFPLEKDTTYCFSAYLKLSPGSKYASNAFGFLVSKEPTYIDTDKLLQVQPSKHLNTQILNYKSRWMKVQCTYKASGGEQYLTLGSFQNHKELKLEGVPGNTVESYYYIDDVSLVPVSRAEDCACNFADQRKDTTTLATETKEPEVHNPLDSLKKGDKIVLDNIHFAHDDDELLPESFATLSLVAEYLQNRPKVSVEISGHTSSLGSKRHNYILSQKRADAVRKFMVNNGIDEKRISTTGYGPDFPIASDDTEAGQKENRRVEFKILAM